MNQTQDWPEERWNEIAYRPLISTDVRFDVRAALAGGTLSVALQVASDDLHFRQTGSGAIADMDIAFIEKTVAPTNVRVFSASIEVPTAAALPATVSVPRELMLNPQTTSVRIIVRDKSTGRYGSAPFPACTVASAVEAAHGKKEKDSAVNGNVGGGHRTLFVLCYFFHSCARPPGVSCEHCCCRRPSDSDRSVGSVRGRVDGRSV